MDKNLLEGKFSRELDPDLNPGGTLIGLWLDSTAFRIKHYGK
jgi:hypothetical protein